RLKPDTLHLRAAANVESTGPRMKLTRVITVWLAAILVAAFALWIAPGLRAGQAGLRSSLTDQEFWDFTEMASEANGSFQSENFMSNERAYQTVIPELLRTA